MIYYKKKIQQDVGATAVEYGILSALIAVVTILGLQATGTNLGTTYCTIANQLSQAVGAGATASGCSASSSSSSSSSSSADSSGSSSSSADSSSSGSADSSSSSSSANSSSDNSSGTVYNASNAWTMGSGTSGVTINNILFNMDRKGETINGIYDADGNALTTSEDIASYLGIQSEYDAFNNANDGYPKGTATSEDVSNALTALDKAMYGPTKQIYIPDPTKVSTSGINGLGTDALSYRSQKAGEVAGTTTYTYGPASTSTRTTSSFILAPPTNN